MITHWNCIVHDLPFKKSNTPFAASPAARWASPPGTTAILEEVVMTRLEVVGHAHRDAVRLDNGKEVLLQSLNAGITAEMVDAISDQTDIEVEARPIRELIDA